MPSRCTPGRVRRKITLFALMGIACAYSPVLAIAIQPRGRAASTCFVGPIHRHPARGHPRLLHLHAQYESSAPVHDIQSSVEENVDDQKERDFFVADAQFVHLGPAARILTEEFYSQRTNFITFQIERLKTVLSLESTFPNAQNSLRKEYSRRPLQQMIVACNAKNGQVVGFAEVDARPLNNSNNYLSAEETKPSDSGILRSYMYNLATDKEWKRKGVASALVEACEQFVSDRHDSCVEKRLYLRVRTCNDAAVGLYRKLGYIEMDPETIELSKDDVNSGSLEEGELILFAKDLPLDSECLLE